MKKTFLPIIGNGPTVIPQADKPERELFQMMKEHPEQKRPSLNWHDLLCEVAEHRCMDMATRGYFSHVDPDGKGPNWWCREFGYRLPDYYHPSDDFNSVESISAYGSPTDVWTVLLNSPGHRTHLLGLDPFYAAQTNIGIGHVYVEGSEWGHYYVILSAPPEV